MKLHDFDYDLPENFIAQEPAEPRDSSKLMVLNRTDESIEHRMFRDIVEYFQPGDVLVMNTTRVIPARLPAVKTTGGSAEILLLRELSENSWRVLIGGRRIGVDDTLHFEGSDITATVTAEYEGAEREVRFSGSVQNLMDMIGQTPLPPYIHTTVSDPERYQTVYNRQKGSAAAPTAGLHFTPDVLFALRNKGVQLAYCVLHIGLDTFQPVRVEDIKQHKIHSEYAQLDNTNAKVINDAKLAGGRIIAVGTTTARTLETAAILSAGGDPSHPAALDNLCPWRPVIAFEQDTRLYIYPGFRWRAVDGLITNFHLPKSSLLMMIGSFMGREYMLRAYETAKEQNYRFFSFGDAMFIR